MIDEHDIGNLPVFGQIIQQVIADSDDSADSDDDELVNMPLKLPNITADMRFDRKKPGTATTWSAFRRRTAQVLEYSKAGQGEWNESHSKRMFYLCLGETELMMTRHILTDVNIASMDTLNDIHEFGTLEKVLDACQLVFQPANESRLAKEAFQRATQTESETLDMYLSRLKLLFSQAHSGTEVDRQDILVDQFVRGIRNTKARYAINSAERSCLKDIDRALVIANAAISAQIAEAPLAKRDQITQGLSSSNLTQKTSLALIRELHEDNTGLSSYGKVISGVAGEGNLNNSFAGGHVEDEPMDINALALMGFGSVEEYDAEIESDLFEGMNAEQMFMIGAIQRGERDLSNMKCYYCDLPNHLIATCYKRQADIKEGTYKKAKFVKKAFRGGTGRGTGRGQRGSNRGGSRGQGSTRGRGGTNTGYSAGMAPGGFDTLPIAEEGLEGDTAGTSGTSYEGQLAAMTLGYGELEQDLEENYIQDNIGAMKDLGFHSLV